MPDEQSTRIAALRADGADGSTGVTGPRTCEQGSSRPAARDWCACGAASRDRRGRGIRMPDRALRYLQLDRRPADQWSYAPARRSRGGSASSCEWAPTGAFKQLCAPRGQRLSGVRPLDSGALWLTAAAPPPCLRWPATTPPRAPRSRRPRRCRSPRAFHTSGAVSITATATGYLLQIVSRGGAQYVLSRNADGGVNRTCTPAGTGSCPATGAW